jgi:hypothetical protein
MCIDYTDFNKHYPKDHSPLPRINSTAGSVDDQDKMVFITPNRIYSNKVMTFGLENVGAAYQKAIQKCLKS